MKIELMAKLVISSYERAAGFCPAVSSCSKE